MAKWQLFKYHLKQLTLEKSDSLGTKSRRKRLWDYLGGRRSKQTRGIECGMSQRGLVLTELQIAIRSRLLFQTTKSQENWEEFERRVWLFIWTIVRYCKYTRKCGHGEMRNKQLRNRKNDMTQGWGVLQSLMSPQKGNEKKEVITTRGIRSWSLIQVRTPLNRA